MLFTGGCSKDTAPLPEQPETPVHGALLQSITWDNGAHAVMDYNKDSTLKQIIYRFRNSTSATIFTWEKKQIKEMYDDRSLYKNTYYYNGSVVSHYINSPKQIVPANSCKMEYGYGDNGRLSSLKYITTNEAGAKVQTVSTYIYNTAGELQEVKTVATNSVITHTIERYTDSVHFNPLVFIETGLFENYPIFNLPLLSSMKKYPQKIIRMVKIGNDDPYTDKIEENICEITNKQIHTITSTITSPGMPDYRVSITGVFKYE